MRELDARYVLIDTICTWSGHIDYKNFLDRFHVVLINDFHGDSIERLQNRTHTDMLLNVVGGTSQMIENLQKLVRHYRYQMYPHHRVHILYVTGNI